MGGGGFRAQCYPPRDFGPGVAALEDPALIESLEARERLHAAKQQYDEVDRAGKARLKADGIRSALAGPFTIEASDRAVREFTVKARTETVYEIRRAG